MADLVRAPQVRHHLDAADRRDARKPERSARLDLGSVAVVRHAHLRSGGRVVAAAEALTERRFFKSHLPFDALPI